MNPPYFALLSYNTYGKTSEREIAIAECKAMARRSGASPCETVELNERLVGLHTAIPIRHAAYTDSVMKRIASAPTVDELCARLASERVSAFHFRIEVRKIPPALPQRSPELQCTVASAIRGKPNLDHPEERMMLVVTTKGLWLGKILEECEKRWRLHRVRPVSYIRSLPTRVARAMLNLVARPGDRVVDPCCGSGTILVEAADMGIVAEGFDINPKMVSVANVNLEYFGFAPVAQVADARRLTGRWDAVVTDLPYGHISNYKDVQQCEEILCRLPELGSRVAVVTGRAEEPLLLGMCGHILTIPLPVSRRLTRYIHVLEPK